MYPVSGSTSFSAASSTFARARDRGQLLQVELCVSGNDGEEMLAIVRVRDQRLEDLLRGQADLARDGDRGEVVGSTSYARIS